MSDVTNLLKELKTYRNDMVARNYPFQELHNLIVKWEEYLAEKDRLRQDTPHSEWIEGYNKWKKQNKD